MTNKEYLEKLSEFKIDEKKAAEIEEIYGAKLPDTIKAIISNCDEPVFLEELRVLSFDEIANAEEDLEVDFKTNHMIPLIDSFDNDYIVFRFDNNTWSQFNIVEMCEFNKDKTLEDFLNQQEEA